LIQNAWDEPGCTDVGVLLETILGRRGYATLTVVDNAPDGFSDLADAWTLFAPSKKNADAEKRGRFNVGEKLVLALCEKAEIVSTRGGVRFDDSGRHSLRTKREFGSSFIATIRFTQTDIAEIEAAVKSLIVPLMVTTTYNGVTLQPRTAIHAFTAQLPTELAGEDGNIRPSRRKTGVMILEALPGETPSLYELGIPVVETGDRCHVDIMQKVPLNTERDNVRPAFLREVRTIVLNEMYSRLDAEDAMKPWAQEALGDERATDEAITHTVGLLYGEKRVAFDPSDPEANSRAVSEGYTVMYGRSLSKEQGRTSGVLVRRSRPVR
jgi:hypothetical protein